MATFVLPVAAVVVGVALGLWSGQMFLALLKYWTDAKVVSGSFMSLVSFLLGGGGGAVITGWLAPSVVAWYVLGLSAGLIIGRFIPLPPHKGTGP